jgi:hypothetical protein
MNGVTTGLEVGVGSRPEPLAVRPGVELDEANVELLTNGVSWYLWSSLAVDHRQLKVATPRTILGLVPIGKHRFTVDLRDLVALTIGTKLNPDRVFAAVVLALAAALGWFGTPGTVLCGVGALAFCLLGLIAVVRIEAHDRPARTVPVCLAHLPRARRFIAAVELRSMAAHRPADHGAGG